LIFPFITPNFRLPRFAGHEPGHGCSVAGDGDFFARLDLRQ
jgi:hypothetical protein